MKKFLAIFMTAVMLLSTLAVLAIPAMADDAAAVEGPDSPYFTRVDISMDKMFASANGADQWSNGDDNGAMTLTNITPEGGGRASNAVIISDVKLDADKDYTVEVKGRFYEGYTNTYANPAEWETKALALIIGSVDKKPWNGGKAYTGMWDRSQTLESGQQISVFTKGGYALENGRKTIASADMAGDLFQSLDWHTLRFTIDYEPTGTTIAFYFDGQYVGETVLDGKKSDGTELANETWEGGYIGMIAAGVQGQIAYKDLCYKEGVTTQTALFKDSVSEADLFTRVDISMDKMSASANGANQWSNGDDNGDMTLTNITPEGGGRASNAVIISDVKLDADKDYTVEVKGRFYEGYTNTYANPAEWETKALALIIGSVDKKPWNGGKAYTGMWDRSQTLESGQQISVFTKGGYALENGRKTIASADMAGDLFQSLDWHTLRFTIDYEPTGTTIAFYFDGQYVGETLLDGKKSDGTELANETWEGGYIGMIAAGVQGQIAYKDLCYKEGVTTAPALFADDISAKRTITVNYVYENGTKAAEPVTMQQGEGAFYSVTSPVIEGFVADKATVSGQVGSENITVTVTYFTSYTVTVHYVDKDGNKKADDVVVTDLKTGDTYSVETMVIPNYTADKTVVEGTIAGANVEVTVTYSKTTYALTVKYVYEDGTKAHDDVVVNVEYDEDGVVASPTIEGYTPDQATVTVEGMRKAATVTVTYTKNAEEVTTAAGTDTTDDSEAEKGCGSSMSLLLIPMTLAAAATVVCKKKK